MKNKNFEVWKNIYEDFYNIPLKYNTKSEVKDEEEKEVKNNKKEKDKNKTKKNGKN